MARPVRFLQMKHDMASAHKLAYMFAERDGIGRIDYESAHLTHCWGWALPVLAGAPRRAPDLLL